MNIIVIVRRIPPIAALMSLIINDLRTMSKGGRGGSVFGREKNFNGLDPLKIFKQKASQLDLISQFSTVFKRFSLLSWCMHWLKNEGCSSPSGALPGSDVPIAPIMLRVRCGGLVGLAAASLPLLQLLQLLQLLKVSL